MIILVVSTSFPIHRGSVSGVFVKRLADGLSRTARVRVVVPDGGQATHIDADYPVHCFRYASKRMQRLAHEPGGLPVAVKGRPFLLLLLPAFLVSFFLAVWQNSRGVTVIQANWSLPGLIAGLVGKIRGIPVFTTLRGDDVSNLQKSLLKRLILRLLAHWNTKLITVSSAMERELQPVLKTTGQVAIHIPNGVADEFFQVPGLVHHGNPLKLLCIGSLIERKQVNVAIEALAEAREPATLTVVGAGPLKEELQAQVKRLGLEQEVVFLGERDSHEIPGLLADHDALVLCSRSEGRPNVVTEAMASGRVVVSTALSGVTEIVTSDQTGLLFDVGDVRGLAGNIERLSREPAFRVRLAEAGRRFVRDQGLTWKRCSQRYLDVFEMQDASAGSR